MELPNNLHLCLPQEGFVHTYIDLMREFSPGGDCTINLGLMIPLALYELNVRGFRLDLQEAHERPRALSIAAVVLAESGLGKSSAWKQLLSLYEQVTGKPHPGLVSAEGTVAGMIENLGYLYNADRDETVGILHSDEFSSVLGGVAGNRFNATLPQFFNTVLSGSTYTKSLRGSKREAGSNLQEVRTPRLTGAFLGVAEGLSFTSEMMNTGFLARMLFLQAAPVHELVPLQGRFLEIPPKRWQILITAMQQWLNQLDYWAGKGALTFSVNVGAVEAFKSLTEALNWRFKTAETSLRTVLARAEWKARVIAAFYATSRGGLVISALDAQQASKLVLESCDVVSRLAGVALGGSVLDVRIERALCALRDAGAEGLLRSALYRSRVGRVASSEREMAEVVGALEDQALIDICPEPVTGKRGRPGMRIWAREHTPENIVKRLEAEADYSNARKKPN